ncbi:MXAN_6640 family putative metalloprotease [Nocardioides nitrophenolicus]|uniref:MXAN_6640 family putative metalloprotease n=1 Tax=Nocardioides nitrophenolicus TaxID=60489 RepID=UPI00195DCA24|nr:MXAN_6640 family putative metalloprotease [Nocardioides nitrophenolicus]MBM7516318.1 hypothetical protein [Nocardioides nitrophenolicus]
MPRRSHFPFIGLPLPLLLSALLAALLAVPFLGAAAQADDTVPAPPAGVAVPVDVDDTAQETAEQALATVQDIVETAPTGTPETGADLTMALRDLALTRDDLPAGLQDDAARLLARPGTGYRPPPGSGGIECTNGSGLPCYTAPEATPECGGNICVHYVASSSDASSQAWAQQVRSVMTNVASRYVAAGYRTPVGDGAVGQAAGGTGNGANVFDVYLADLGKRGLYGYCTTDQRVAGHVTAAAYCVLDNDYAEFGPVPGPIGNLQVTAAHEYFHAVQFAYDVNEDTWLLEATATWAEDEVYPDINDNRQYLKGGPLGQPAQPMDHRQGLAPYGAWIFFKYLSEHFPAANGPGGMPVVVRDIWDLAAGPANARQAINAALAARGTDLRTQFGWFAAANRRPAQNYAEGAAYPRAKLWRGAKLSTSRRSVSDSVELRHLASRTIRFKSKVRGKAHLRVHVNGPSRKKGGYVLVTIKKKGQVPLTKLVKINRKGDKTKRYQFGKKVQWVEITFANSGKKDATAKVSATVVR